MKIPAEMNEKFMASERTDEIKFCLNDPVLIKTGKFKGIYAAVISINSITPEVEYIVESSDGRDLIVKQSEIEFIE